MAIAKKNADMECGGHCCCCGPWCIIGKVLIVLVLPLLLIWALNTLFMTGISYTVFTWFAALVVVLVLSGKGMKGMRHMGMGCGCSGQCNCPPDSKK